MTNKKMIDDVDRISALPDPIIHQIFSTMNMNEVVRSTVLSRRWNNLWKSSPFLYFQLSICKTSRKIKRNAFMDLVDRVLLLRDASSIDRFTVDCWERLDASRVYSWLVAALNRKARELLLIADGFDRLFKLPYHLFTADIPIMSITASCTCEEFYLQLPNSICTSPRIIYLELCGVILPEGNSKGELLISCPVLKHLSLTYCDCYHLRRFTITATLLENLSLVDVNQWKDLDCKIGICCPNLKSLRCDGILHQEYVLDNFLGLETANIGMELNKNTAEHTQRIINFFRGIQTVNSLQLRISSSDRIDDFLEQFKGFPDLQMLRLRSATVSPYGLANFLERSPRLVSFIWDRSYGSYIPEEEEGASYLPVQSEFCCLKSAEIHHAKGSGAELVFLEGLLLKAKVLEHVIVTTKKKQSGFADKLSKLPRACSSVSISCRSLQ